MEWDLRWDDEKPLYVLQAIISLHISAINTSNKHESMSLNKCYMIIKVESLVTFEYHYLSILRPPSI